MQHADDHEGYDSQAYVAETVNGCSISITSLSSLDSTGQLTALHIANRGFDRGTLTCCMRSDSVVPLRRYLQAALSQGLGHHDNVDNDLDNDNSPKYYPLSLLY